MPKGVTPRGWTCPKCSIWLKNAGGHIVWCGKREEHFWSLVNKDGSGGCWLYEGPLSFEGYGYVNCGNGPRRKQYQAHRYAWEILLKKPLPADKLLLHHCDIRNCVNPDHLYLGTRKDNIQDAIRRGRYNHRYTPVEKLLWPHLSRKVKP